MTPLTTLKQRITEYEQRYHRVPGSVTLLAVTKGCPLETTLSLYQQGQRAFGESYLQEALPKISALEDKAIEWHFIGPLQSNKTKKIAEHFSWVHSLDNIDHAKRLNKQRPPSLPPLNICLQVNISGESTKSGMAPGDVLAFAEQCRQLPQLLLRGLMTIPAPLHHFSQQRATYHSMFLLWEMLRSNGFTLDTLSMGMSDDMEAAIAEGATIVRIGRALTQ